MRLLVTDDHPLVRKGVVSTLSFEDNIEKVYEASNVEEAMRLLSNEKPEIAIIDLKLGKEDGLDIVSKAKENRLKTKFIVLTSSSKQEDFRRAQKANVDGYILKDAFAEDIIYAFRVVARGKKFFDSGLLQYSTSRDEEDQLTELTPREIDVLAELGKGLSNIQIGKTLFISEHTVKKHVSNILSKLDLTHRTQAALFANNSI